MGDKRLRGVTSASVSRLLASPWPQHWSGMNKWPNQHQWETLWLCWESWERVSLFLRGLVCERRWDRLVEQPQSEEEWSRETQRETGFRKLPESLRVDSSKQHLEHGQHIERAPPPRAPLQGRNSLTRLWVQPPAHHTVTCLLFLSYLKNIPFYGQEEAL